MVKTLPFSSFSFICFYPLNLTNNKVESLANILILLLCCCSCVCGFNDQLENRLILYIWLSKTTSNSRSHSIRILTSAQTFIFRPLDAGRRPTFKFASFLISAKDAVYRITLANSALVWDQQLLMMFVSLLLLLLLVCLFRVRSFELKSNSR